MSELSQSCGEPHPVTGNGCTLAPSHDGHHEAMGMLRYQIFGRGLETSV